MMHPEEVYKKLTNALAKWRNVHAAKMFGYWKSGKEYNSDPRKKAQYDEYTDLRELCLILRAEVNALTSMLAMKRVCTREELILMMNDETGLLIAAWQKKFPGMMCNWDTLAIMNREEWKKTREQNGLPPLPQELN